MRSLQPVSGLPGALNMWPSGARTAPDNRLSAGHAARAAAAAPRAARHCHERHHQRESSLICAGYAVLRWSCWAYCCRVALVNGLAAQDMSCLVTTGHDQLHAVLPAVV